MNKILITFGGRDYDTTTGRMFRDAPELGEISQMRIYDDVWMLNTEFYKNNPFPWSHPHKRGFGWYCWKPYIIWHALQHYAELGDVVMYLDADCYPVKDFRHLFYQCDTDGGIMLFRAGHWKHANWCKRDCFVVMDADNVRYTNPNQDAGVARFMLFQKQNWMSKPEQFLAEWLTYCINPLATTFDPSRISTEYYALREHRAEQAIMTNLAIKYNLNLYPEADSELGLFVQDNTRPLETRQTTAKVLGSAYANVY